MESDKYLRYLDDVVESIKDCPKGRNKCTVLIGAGCSVSAGIPLSSGIIEKIREDFPKAYERADPKTYSKCMEMLAPEQRRKLINDYIKNAKINWAHLCLAKLMDKGYVDRILTTNFDPLALRACALLGRVPAVYDITSFTAAFKPNIIPDKSIFYLHGQCTGFNLVNTEEELRKNINNLLPFFKDSLQGRTWVVVGYSGADPVFDELIKVDCFDNNLFWACHDDEPAGYIKEKLLKDGKYAFYLKQFDADDFFIQLTQKLGCFPEIATKPFSHIKALLEMVTDYPLTGADDAKDITKEGIQLAEKAVKQYEIKPLKIDAKKKGSKIPELMYAKGLLSEAKFDELINLIDENVINVSDEWKDLKVSAYSQKGVYQFRESKQESGSKKEALINEAISLFDQAINLKPDDPYYLNNKAGVLIDKAKLKSGKERDDLFVEAETSLRAAEYLNPGCASYSMACLMALREREEECKEWLDKALEKNRLPSLHYIENDNDLKIYKDRDWFINFIIFLRSIPEFGAYPEFS
jgi:hypothetical protein